MSGPQRRRFIFLGGGLGAHLRVPVSPAGEVLSSPQMSVMREHQVAGGNGRDPQIEILAIRNRINPVSDEILRPLNLSWLFIPNERR